MKPGLTSTCILLLLPAILLAQNLPFTTYTSKDGLASDRVTAITQDEQGAMWFGSYYGICRYDGQKFENIRLPVQQKDKYVSFLLASRGRIYAGFLFNGGLFEYEKGKMKSHFLPAGTGTSNTFICMTDNGDGSYLIANNTGHIYNFHDGRFTFLSNLDPSAGQVQHLQKAGNQLQVATDKGLYVLSVSGEKQSTFFQGDNIIALQLRENTSWLLRLQGNTLVFDEFLKDPAKPSRQIRRPQKGIVVATRRPDMLWVLNGTDLLRIDSAGSSEYPAAVRTAANATAIFCDRENNVWLASEPGVVKISNFASQNFTTADINPAGGGLARQNDSTLWYTNSKSLFRIVNSRITRVPDILDGMPEHYGLLHLENNHLWIVLWNGLLIRARIENDRLVTDREFVKFKGRELNVSTVVSDDMGNVWAGGINGIYHIRGGRVIGHSDLEQAGGAAFITCISLDEKNKVLWIGDNAAGVTRLAYDFLPDGTCTYKVLRHLGSREGLHDTYTRSILADQEGNVWVGTRFGGIFRIREDAGKLQVVSVNTAANLGCNRITDISAEDTNAVWFAACDGVYRYTYKDNSWRHFTTSDGLLNAEVFKLLAD
ncbi:MAG TPA: two-component regulator propeller domain-containing protein, partial [Flavisolibacter sp.]